MIGSYRAHPRACGENNDARVEYDEAVGSSPRMRGKLETAYMDGTNAGLIPAHAGKTFSPPV